MPQSLGSNIATGAAAAAPPVFLPPSTTDPFVILAAEIRFLALALQGHSMSVNSTNLKIFDKIAASYHVQEMNATVNTLAQLPDLIRGGDGAASLTYGFGSDSPILLWLPAADGTVAALAPNILIAAQYKQLMSAAAKQASNQGFSSLDKYLSSINAAAPFSGLVHPNFALISYAVNNGQGTLLLSPGNVFAPLTTFGSAAIGPAAGAVTFQPGSVIPAANVVNSSAYQSLQGYTAAPGAAANITATINGTLTLTLTATGQNAAGQAVTGRVWTAVLDNAAAGTTVPFVPAVAGDRIYSAAGIAGAGAATAGAFSVSSVVERVAS